MTKAIDRREVLAAAAAGTAMLFAPPILRPARAARRLTIASLLGEDKPETLIWLHMQELLDQALPGRFAFNVVPDAALGGEREVAEGVRLGSIQGTLLTVSALSGWVPESQILDLPFLFRDADHLSGVLGGALGEEMRARFREQSFVVPAFINYGARHLLAKEPLTRPDELRGKRIRVIQSPLHTELWSAYGAVPTAIPITETYNALATGVVDAMDLTKSAYAGFRLYEVVPNLIETGHIWASGVVCFSAGLWDGLAEEERVVLEATAREGAGFFNRLIVEDETASIAAAELGGAVVIQPDDRAAWEAGARPVWETLADEVGGMAKIEAVRTASS